MKISATSFVDRFSKYRKLIWSERNSNCGHIRTERTEIIDRFPPFVEILLEATNFYIHLFAQTEESFLFLMICFWASKQMIFFSIKCLVLYFHDDSYWNIYCSSFQFKGNWLIFMTHEAFVWFRMFCLLMHQQMPSTFQRQSSILKDQKVKSCKIIQVHSDLWLLERFLCLICVSINWNNSTHKFIT